MKKITSIICSIVIILTSISIALPAFASTEKDIDTVIENLSELYQEEAENDKDIEESAECRIIVKANQKPNTYGNAELIKGTDKIYIYQYSDITSANEALDYYKSLDFVKWVETDGILEGQSLSYGNDMIGSDEAKAYIANNNISTQEVNVAVIDGGINFRKKDFINTNRVIDSGVNLSDTGTEGTAQQDPGNYHGSNITSIILDNTTDNVNIIGYKVMNRDGTGTASAAAMGIEKAVEDGVDIINLSLVGEGESQILMDAVNEAVESGVVVIVSAGNYNDDVSKYCPAFMDNVITVGALDYNGNIAFFSNHGEEVDFVAPGYNIEVWGNKSISSAQPDYENGTSFAAPFVTAASAMVLSVHPHLSPDGVKDKLIDSCVNQNEINYESPYLKAIEISNDYLTGFVFGEEAESEDLYYGYGMPQMQQIVGADNKCTSPVFSVSSGIYNNEFELALTADNNSDIYYSLDGTYPSANRGILYTEPITVSSTTSIRAIAYSEDKIKSVPSSCEYKMEYYADESEFTIDSRGYITGYLGESTEIIVPATVNGLTVKGVAKNAFYDDLDPSDPDVYEQYGDLSDHLQGIVLPDTVSEIEENSFSSYVLKYFTAHGLKTVGDFALETPLVYLDAPNIESIGVQGLSTSLSEINLPNLKTAEDSAFRGNKYLSYVYLPNLETVSSAAFCECYRLQTARLDSARKIYDIAFYMCSWLKNVYFPNVEIIDDESMGTTMKMYVFDTCINLKKLDFPSLENVTAQNCFSNCKHLISFNAPNLTNISDNMFYFCYRLTDVNIPNVTKIEKQGFNYTLSLKELSLPNVIEIGNEAFLNSGLSFLDTPVLHSIGSRVFAGYSELSKTYNANNSLEYFYAPSLVKVEDYAFAYTGGLTQLDSPNLATIGENAFYESSVNYLYAPSLKTASSLPTAENSLAVVSEALQECTYNAADSSLIIQGAKGTYGEEYANKYNLEFIEMNAKGGSIRVTDAGLRFGYSFYDTQEKDVEEYGFVYTQGVSNNSSLIIENVDNINTYKLIAKNRITHEDNTTTFNLVFTNIPASAYSIDISARAYVKIDGVYYYSDVLQRSFNQVADAVLADDEIDQSTKDLLNKLLEV